MPREKLPEVARQLRDDAHLRFEICVSVSGVHYPDDEGAELHAVYHFLSITHKRRIRVEVTCPDSDPHIPSLVRTYPMTDWHERETYDMFGLVFDGHPHLTRILMPDDWVGFPQRKDYPLGGVPVEYKGAVVPPPDQRRSQVETEPSSAAPTAPWPRAPTTTRSTSSACAARAERGVPRTNSRSTVTSPAIAWSMTVSTR